MSAGAVRADARKRREPERRSNVFDWAVFSNAVQRKLMGRRRGLEPLTWPDERPDAETSAMGRLWIERIDHRDATD